MDNIPPHEHPVPTLHPASPNPQIITTIHSANFHYALFIPDPQHYHQTNATHNETQHQFQIAANEQQHRRCEEDYDKIAVLQAYLEEVARRDTDSDAGIEWGWQVNELVGKLIGFLEKLAWIQEKVHELGEEGGW